MIKTRNIKKRAIKKLRVKKFIKRKKGIPTCTIHRITTTYRWHDHVGNTKSNKVQPMKV